VAASWVSEQFYYFFFCPIEEFVTVKISCPYLLWVHILPTNSAHIRRGERREVRSAGIPAYFEGETLTRACHLAEACNGLLY